jgi:hypothetical protein
MKLADPGRADKTTPGLLASSWSSNGGWMRPAVSAE